MTWKRKGNGYVLMSGTKVLGYVLRTPDPYLPFEARTPGELPARFALSGEARAHVDWVLVKNFIKNRW